MDPLNESFSRRADLVDWSEANDRVEAYFCALQIHDRLLLSQLVAQILSRVAERVDASAKSASVLAMEEAKEVVRAWFGRVLDAAGVVHGEVGAQGRLALFLADMPARWQSEFLHAGPWPAEFLEAMKTTYLGTGPDFRKVRMTPREIDLGPVSAVADETWRVIDRWPILGALFVWTLYLGGVALLVYLLR